MPPFTISQLARQAIVPPTTVRYYERRGLLPVPMRTASGYRLYSGEAVRQVRFIKHSQELGFSLKEIGELLRLLSRKASSAKVCEVTNAKIIAVDEKIAQLKALRKKLSRLVLSCDGKGTVEECLIIKHLFA